MKRTRNWNCVLPPRSLAIRSTDRGKGYGYLDRSEPGIGIVGQQHNHQVLGRLERLVGTEQLVIKLLASLGREGLDGPPTSTQTDSCDPRSQVPDITPLPHLVECQKCGQPLHHAWPPIHEISPRATGFRFARISPAMLFVFRAFLIVSSGTWNNSDTRSPKPFLLLHGPGHFLREFSLTVFVPGIQPLVLAECLLQVSLDFPVPFDKRHHRIRTVLNPGTASVTPFRARTSSVGLMTQAEQQAKIRMISRSSKGVS
ncbi:MAG: hypothetical protein Ct9H300mP1_14300 [Planctomycetaceae bacterium]|nr:MAG: hypothetical protein Ct9H300mP1_14300 [Planctomycetaceae bacterium]